MVDFNVHLVDESSYNTRYITKLCFTRVGYPFSRFQPSWRWTAFQAYLTAFQAYLNHDVPLRYECEYILLLICLIGPRLLSNNILFL